MSNILIAKIKSSVGCGAALSIAVSNEGNKLSNGAFFEPEFKLSSLLKDYDGSMVVIQYKTFNKFEDIEREKKSAKTHDKHVRLNRVEGVLRVAHHQIETDLDKWFESSVKLEIYEKVQRKRGMIKETSNKIFDFDEYLEKKEGKVFYFEISKVK